MAAARAEVGPDIGLVGVIGSPIGHSLSPVLHAAAFEALGVPWRSFAFEVPAGEASAALAGVRELGLRGISVTMPHKDDVARLVDVRSDVAEQLGAVNCVVNDEDTLLGANTDGAGFVASLQRGAGFSVEGRRCLVLGAGGAARAVVQALASAGASEVTVMNRTSARAEAAVTLAGAVGRLAEVGEIDAAAQADLVVNATPLGMVGVDAPWLVDPSLLHSGQLAADLVYSPRVTPWLEAAATAGAATLGGLGMLVHQAAEQIELWTGREAPIEAMWEAVALSA
jgi:shikimate dehydrogenase